MNEYDRVPLVSDRSLYIKGNNIKYVIIFHWAGKKFELVALFSYKNRENDLVCRELTVIRFFRTKWHLYRVLMIFSLHGNWYIVKINRTLIPKWSPINLILICQMATRIVYKSSLYKSSPCIKKLEINGRRNEFTEL